MLKNHKLISISEKNSYLEFDIRVRRANGNPFNFGLAPAGEKIRLVNNVFAYTIHDAKISTIAGVEIGQNKYVGAISKIMKLVTQKDGDLSTYFDTIDESEDEINNSSLKKLLIDNHADANRGLIRGRLPLIYIYIWFHKIVYKSSERTGFRIGFTNIK